MRAYFFPMGATSEQELLFLGQKRTRRGKSWPERVGNELQGEVVGNNGHKHCPCASLKSLPL